MTSLDYVARLAPLRVTAETSPAIFHERELFQEYPELNRWPLNKVLPSGGHMTIWSDCMLPTTLSGSTL
jgi:hypothetical protein